MDQNNNSNTETHTVKLNKVSFWTVLKILMGCYAITAIVNNGSYLIVAMNHGWSQVIGLVPEGFAKFCADCLRAIG